MVCIKCKKEIENDSTYCNYCGKKQAKEARKTLRRANGTGSVYKLPGRRKKPWAAVITKYDGGIRHTTPIGYFAQKTEALNALAEINTNAIPDQYNATLRDVYNEWKSSHFADLTDSGITNYEAAWNYLKIHAAIKMRDIRTEHFQSVVDDAVSRHKSRSTCEKIKQLCSQLCKRAMQDDLINKNYAQFVRLPKAEKREKEKFSQSEIDLLFANSDNETAKIILTLIYSGMRINELFSVEKADVYLNDGYIIGGEKTEAGKDRIIPINEKIEPFIENWYRQNTNSKYLICSRKGTKINDQNFRNRRFYPLLESLNIIPPVKKGEKPRLTPHSTRHTFISMMVDKDAKPELLKVIVGHEQYETTIDFYNQISKEDIKKLIDTVNLI